MKLNTVKLTSRRALRIATKASNHRNMGIDMGGTGKKKELPGNDEKKAKKTPASPVEDDDHEDGDFATPKRDRHGNDDEPI
jgi:hypothetical protein